MRYHSLKSIYGTIHAVRWMILVFLFLWSLVGMGQVNIINPETMYNGVGGATGDPIALHESNDRFENDALFMSGTGDMRTTLPSSGYAGASGSWNVMLNANTKTFQISDINTSSYTSIALLFGFKQASGAATAADFSVEVSDDGAIWTPLNITFSGTTNWYLNLPSGTIPATTNLRIKFTNKHSAAWDFRIDDIKLTGMMSCTSPSVQSSNLQCSTPGFQNINLQWTNGNGSGRIVKINTVNTFTNPVNGTDPTAVSNYSGSGEQVVYNGNGNTVNISNLDPCRDYWFRAYEYNCSGSGILFNTSTSTGNPVMISTSSNPPSSLTVASENFEGATTWPYLQQVYGYGAGSAANCVVSIKSPPFGYISSKALVKSHSVDLNGNNGSEAQLEFDEKLIPVGSTNIKFSFRLASLNTVGTTTGGAGPGHDVEDFFSLNMQLNASGTYSPTLKEIGSGNKLFPYLPEKGSTITWDQNSVFSNPTNDFNYFTVTIPNGTTKVKVQFIIRNNRTDENWCIDEMSLTADMPTASTLPTVFSITGNSSFCEGSTGTIIGLSGSQTGVSYQLFLNGVAVGSPVAGTGSAIAFGYQSLAGTYTVIATNTSFQYCKSIMLNPLVVTFLPSPSISNIATTPAACGVDNGTITITATGVSTPYSYSIDNGATWHLGNAFLGLAAGNYQVKVRGGNTCESSASTATITLSGSTLNSTITQTNVLCFGNNTGSATVTGSGGSGTLSYSWNTSPNQLGSTASNLYAGTYICTITDAVLCSIDVTVVISQPLSALNGGIVSQTNAGCFGTKSGSAEVSGNGGTPTYSYSWNTIPVQTGSVANNLAAGIYTCTISDINGCQKLVSVTILEPTNALSATTSFTNVSCYGGNNGSATVSVSGGTPLYNYLWNTNPPQYSATAFNLIAGSYICTITDANSCIITKTAVINGPASSLNASLVSTPALICSGANNGTATVTVSGGTPGYTYSWNTTPIQITPTAINLPEGSFVCTITDLNSCTYDLNVDILTYPPPTTSNAGGNQNVCGLTTTLNANIPAIGAGLWTMVSGPIGVTFGNPSSPITMVSSTLVGTYVLQWTITNQAICPSSLSQVSIVFGPTVSVLASYDIPVCTGYPLNLHSSISGATYAWTGPNGYTSNLQNPTIPSVQLSHAGDYTVIVTGIPGGCPQTSATTNVVVNISPIAPISVNSSITSLCSDDNGNIILTANGGSGASLEWFAGMCGGTSIGTGNNFSLPLPLVTTTYYARWNSALCGNSACQSVTVLVSDPPTTAHAGSDKNVCGYTTTLAGNPPITGTGQWTQVSGPAIVTFGNVSSPTSQVTTTSAGTYTFRWTISTSSPCTPSSDDVVVTFGDAVTVSAGSNNPVCAGDDIFLTASISGATYAWIGPDGFSSSQQNPVIPDAQNKNMGVYFVTVSNIPGGCPDASDDIAVVITPKPTTNYINNNSLGADDICNNTTVPYTIDPPTAGSTYVWSLSGGGTILPTGASNLINVQWSTVGGPYKLSVVETTSEGCAGDPVSIFITVAGPSSPAVSIDVSQNPVCTGSPVTFTADPQSGGLNPQYNWYINGIGPVGTGIKYVYIPVSNDTVQCRLTSSSPCAIGNPAFSNKILMTVAGTVAAGISISTPAQSLCIGDMAKVKAQLNNGGTAPLIKWYKNGIIVPGEVDTIFNFTPINGDKIHAELISNSPCASPAQGNSAEIIFIVSNALPLSVSLLQDAVACYGMPVTIRATTANQGSAPVYEWSLNGLPLPGVSGNVLTEPFAEGDKVSLEVSSSLSCSTGSPALSNEVVVSMPAPLALLKADTTSASCGENNGSIEINALGGTGSYAYSVMPVETWRSQNHFDSIAPGVHYHIKVKDKNGCIGDFGIIIISSLPGPEVVATGPTSVCEGSKLEVEVSSATAGLIYEWQSPDGKIVNGNTLIMQQVTLSDSGVYIAKGSTLGGCNDTVKYMLNVVARPVVDFGFERTACQGFVYTLDAGAGFVSYQWHDGAVSQAYTASTPGDYFVEVTDKNGCMGDDTLRIVPCGNFYFPNAFSPNGDGNNETFIPVTGGLNPQGFKMIIFSCWGQKLFETNDPTSGWDGSIPGGQAPVGIYTFLSTYSLPDPDNMTVYMKPVTKRGLVVLIR